MTADQKRHLSRVIGAQDALIARKYEAGQIEHGGNCWQKPGMLAHALDEAADLPVYLWTLREQLTEIADMAEQTERPDLAAMIRRVILK